MATSNNGKGGGKASPAALSHEEEFSNWATKEKKKKRLDYFPNSPKSPNGK
jgi:hypothetical protein